MTLHWLIGNFHDHLENTPQIAFTNAAGNFEDADRVVAQNIDGANTRERLPGRGPLQQREHDHVPRGHSPHMQMYLTQDFFDPTGRSTAFDASVVYHEYTHGLVGRTITDAGGFQAVGGAQSGAINEGTADWYAMDYLVGAGLEPDSGTPDVMRAGSTRSAAPLRADGLPRGDLAGAVPGAARRGRRRLHVRRLRQGLRRPGGPRRRRDLGPDDVAAPQALIAAHGATTGVEHARQLFTNGMRLAPDNPSFLDLRNAILQADTAGALGDAATIWTVFAQRGMGYFASTRDSGDTQPVENFSMPPAPGGPTGTLTGTVTDADELTPAAGVKVAFAGHDSGVGPELSDVTDGTGAYSIPDVPTGHLPAPARARRRLRGGRGRERRSRRPGRTRVTSRSGATSRPRPAARRSRRSPEPTTRSSAAARPA